MRFAYNSVLRDAPFVVSSPQENQDGNSAGEGKPAQLALPAPPGSAGGTPKPKAAAPPPHSCLDALWALLQRAPELRREHPAALAKALQAVAALWQEGGATLPQCLLRGQPAFWSGLGDLLREAAAEGPVSGPGDLAHAEGWAALGGAASRLAAEAHALQVVACEAYLWEATPGNGAGGGCLAGSLFGGLEERADLACFSWGRAPV